MLDGRICFNILMYAYQSHCGCKLIRSKSEEFSSECWLMRMLWNDVNVVAIENKISPGEFTVTSFIILS